MSYKSILKSNIKSIDGTKIQKRNVRVVCLNGEAGKTVQSVITQNSSELFGGYAMNKMTAGLDGNKDFTVKFAIRDGAQYFYDKLNAILNDKSVPAGESEKSKWEKAGEKAKETLVGIADQIFGGQPAAPAVAEPTAPAVAEPAAATEPAGNGSGNKTLIIAGVAVIVILVIALVVWKKKK